MSSRKNRKKNRLRFLPNKTGGPSPGTLVHLGERKVSQPKITIIHYTFDNYLELQAKKVEDCFPYRNKEHVSWINITGLHDVELLQRVGLYFEIHPLTLEDILNTTQRPKFEDHGTHVFITVKIPSFDPEKDEITVEQVSLVIAGNYLLSFQESDNAFFMPVKERIRNGRGRIRKLGTDYLGYAVLDAIVDSYFSTLEKLEQRIQSLDELLSGSIAVQPEAIERAHLLKRDILWLRSIVLPIREVANDLLHTESDIINESIEIFLRDLYDHSLQVAEALDTTREILDGMIDIYLSGLSFRMNEVMKVFTVITSIFIPLTFVASIYGMNFKFMPELETYWGYPTVLLSMLLLGLIMLAYFRRKKWF